MVHCVRGAELLPAVYVVEADLVNEVNHQPEEDFGLQFNPSYVSTGNRSARPVSCPTWAKPMQVEDWQHRGIVVWQNSTQRIVALSGIEAVHYLDRLRANSDWEQAGLSLTRQVHRIHLPPTRQRGRRKKGEPEPPPEPPETTAEVIDEEIMRLDPEQTRRLLDLLQQSEATLRQMAESEKEAQTRALHQVYTMIFESHRKHESAEFQWATRQVRWVQDEKPLTWSCELSPNRAKIFCKDYWFWEVCIDRRNPSGPGYNRFLQLEGAVAWAEEQLSIAALEDARIEQAARQAPATSANRPKLDLTPFRIEPNALEPERVSYRVVIEFETVPDSFKTMELLCGDELQYDKRYPSVHKLALDLLIDDAQFELEQPLGPNDDWNLGQSTVTYFRESVTVEQAQLVWNKSRIVEYFRRGKLVRARYGVQEVETKYTSWLGACEREDKPWGKEHTREEYMAEQAHILTLANALDIDGFRALLGVDLDTLDDERLLASLHRRRVQSRVIPSAARKESEQWLRGHDDARERRYG